MDEAKLRRLLEAIEQHLVTIDDAVAQLRSLPFEDLGFAKVDHHRMLRRGFPETVFCAGKTREQVLDIVNAMRAHGSNVLATRCTRDVAEALCTACPEACYHEVARAVSILAEPVEPLDGCVAVLCAGTSDIPVAEEAVVAAESVGCTVRRVYDVGVAGLHRLLDQRATIEAATVLVVCAGMEGALASVVAGLVDKPVIAVPTSVGYGASFGGVAALLSMLNSCATGVSVVNIDNGYGAGMLAGMINRIASARASSD
ncbi:MAG TPA: nickel pincer cofactor biosynthesis protein LarB [Candidatus Hydrogenedentes bacterium]|nr:nickel pincer cofactor biosynthesis protein LarB [Candidatus Hydrogenedentota bacterium]HOZ49318.1 nickel pincer cofactor biosynthesis protein LarB [Candidatus Hydrogenedentota bacterium]HPG69671.1 nickel pincer cofactor biosynthesis protein LarB [Candidatus Hydrogenedentota bacterium]